MSTLTGKVALITGSSRGIGAAIATEFARAAAFLASNSASWITGVILDVAGGAVLV